jgi:hypothetical protein
MRSLDPTMLDALKRMRAAWPSRGWSWDSRLNCITSSFSTDFEAKARGAIAEALQQRFTAANLATAPRPVREVVERSGGLRSSQVAFAGGNPPGLLVFGLWWPWNDQATISLRVGLCDVDLAQEPYPSFREIFGVEL